MEVNNIKNVVYEGPGLLVLSDSEWQKGLGINIRLKHCEPVNLKDLFTDDQISKSYELNSAINAGKVRVLTDEEMDNYQKVETPSIVKGKETVIYADETTDQFMVRLSEIEDKEEELDGVENTLRITPRKKKTRIKEK